MSILNLYKDYKFTSYKNVIPIEKENLCSIIQDILSNKTPYCLSVSRHTGTFSQEYYKTSILKNNKIIEEYPEFEEELTFSLTMFLSYLLTCYSFNYLYKVSFDPSKVQYFITDDKIINQYMLDKSKRFDMKSIDLEEVMTIFSKRLLFSFKETPSFVIDNVVYTNNNLSNYNDRLIYMFGIFMLYKHNEEEGDFFINILTNESFKNLMKIALEKDDFDIIKNNIVLDQFMPLIEYLKYACGYMIKSNYNTFDQYIVKNTFEPYQFIKYKKIEGDFNSQILLEYANLCNSNYKITDENKTYDDLLIKELTNILQTKEYDKFTIKNYYKFPYNIISSEYPEINDFQKNDKIIKSGLSAFYLQCLYITLKSIEVKTSKVDISSFYYAQSLRKLKIILQPYYFSIQMLYSPYGQIYLKGLENNNANKYINYNLQIPKVAPLSASIYYPQYTLTQFYALINLYNKKKDLQDLIAKIIFYWTRDKKYTYKTIEDILKDATIGNDVSVYRKLRTIHEQYNPNTSFDRGAQRIKDLNSFRFFDLLDITPEFKYLDFGGANGELTVAIAKYLKLNKEQVFVSDIKSWFNTENISEYTKNVTLRYLTTSLLPFEDNSLNLVSAFQVFHHIKHMDMTLKEINRVLKEDGILLIREHDCDSIATRTLIDLDHSLREMSTSDIENLDFLHTYTDDYYSMKNMTNLIVKYGFVEKQMNYQPPKGTTRYYYKVFIKKTNIDKLFTKLSIHSKDRN
jgi:ubiquinone/menaquinone biosynthesis C-methylase UbiE